MFGFQSRDMQSAGADFAINVAWIVAFDRNDAAQSAKSAAHTDWQRNAAFAASRAS
jgi:hypothetical protein